MMSVFGEKRSVFKTEGLALGEFDPTVSGFYKNVQIFSFQVKKKKVIRAYVSSDVPVDVAVSDEKGSTVSYKQAVKEGMIGPIPTESNTEMSIVLGITPGDKAKVSAEVWMERL